MASSSSSSKGSGRENHDLILNSPSNSGTALISSTSTVSPVEWAPPGGPSTSSSSSSQIDDLASPAARPVLFGSHQGYSALPLQEEQDPVLNTHADPAAASFASSSLPQNNGANASASAAATNASASVGNGHLHVIGFDDDGSPILSDDPLSPSAAAKGISAVGGSGTGTGTGTGIGTGIGIGSGTGSRYLLNTYAETPVDETTWSGWSRARWTRFKYYLRNSWRECTKRKFQYCLAFFCIFIVVFISAACFTLVEKAPAIFLQQAEESEGQIDLILTSNLRRNPYMNFSAVLINAAVSPFAQYTTGRFVGQGYIAGPRCRAEIDSYGVSRNSSSSISDLEWMYIGDPAKIPEQMCSTLSTSCFAQVCVAKDLASVRIGAIDTERERRMGLGRKWPYPAIPPNTVYISPQAAITHKVAEGDDIVISFYSNALVKHQLLESFKEIPKAEQDQYLPRAALQTLDRAVGMVGIEINFVVKVGKIMNQEKGKFGASSVMPDVLFEHDHFWSFLSQRLHPTLKLRDLREIAARTAQTAPVVTYPVLPWSPAELLQPTLRPGLNMFPFMTEIIVNIPPERVDAYLQSDTDKLQRSIVQFASSSLYFVGFTESNAKLPLVSSLRPLKFFALFFGLILSVILTILFILSFMLIYSLLMISIETRTFELGVHRMTGLTTWGIVNMLIIQAFSYSIPSWATGLVMAQVVCTVAIRMLSNSIEVPLVDTLSPNGIIVATVLGLAIPLVAAILPIRDALSKNLQDALDTRHSKTAGVSFSIERSEDSSISKAALVLGIGLTVFGFLIYYLLPLSLLTLNFALFFDIFFGILLGLLFGLIILSFNFEHILERFLVAIFFFWELRSIPKIVLKNLVAHRIRNRKTTMMYAVSLGFVIFITVAFTTEMESAKAQTIKQEGANMVISVSQRANAGITFTQLQQIEAVLENHPAVENWAWQTVEHNLKEQFTAVRTSNLGHIFEHAINVMGVSPTYNDVVYDEYYTASREDRRTDMQFAEQLYTVRGSQSAVIDSALAEYMNLRSLDKDSTFLLAQQYNENGVAYTSLDLRSLKPMAMMDSAAGIPFTSFTTNRNYHMIVSIPSFMRLSNGTYNSIQQLQYSKLYIKTKGSKTDKDNLYRSLRVITSGAGISLFDDRDLESSLGKTRTIMDLIFGSVTYIAMFLCLFSLIASMYSNIYESAKEIAVMRAIGLKIGQITRIYIYEAFILVLAASLIGIVIGFVMGFTMTLQRVLFTQLPIQFVFPWLYVLLVLGAAVICSLISSWTPIRFLASKTISSIFRTVM